MLNIVEKFITISGEAPIIGSPVYLIRFSGCNLDCKYCDTKYHDEVNFSLTDDELMDDINNVIKSNPFLKVLLTGGEPFSEERQDKILNIIKKLKKVNFYIETNGSIKIKNFELRNIFYIIDWKAPSSNNEIFFIDNLKFMRKTNDCIKFVVAEEDLCWLLEKVNFLTNNFNEIPLFVSAQYGKINLENLSNFIIKNKLPLKLSIQLHKLIWPNRDRGV
ncbi:MAG: 4Fe-4S cluster-binding domain-containing protein [Spirochaetes bacterium]|nr:4Fe-4S cluster-binding domain-containing protein [Spirochaetota bacterium]